VLTPVIPVPIMPTSASAVRGPVLPPVARELAPGESSQKERVGCEAGRPAGACGAAERAAVEGASWLSGTGSTGIECKGQVAV
jgi:hypothetical protein